MLERIIIADTSVLIAFDNIGELELLRKIYRKVSVTPQISAEFGDDLPEWIIIEQVSDAKKIELLTLELDLGEASAIALAIEQSDSLLIIDERKGRAIAKRMGLKITGTLGVIIKAKESGTIEKVKPIIEKLENVNFRISHSLKQKILSRLGEGES